MMQNRTRRFWLSAAQSLLGSAGVALLTYVCYRLGLDLATTSLLDLIAVVLLSLTGTFGSAAVVAISAALSLNYLLVPPRLSLWPEASFDFVAVAAFLITALVISRLLSKARQSLHEAQAARDQLRLAVDAVPALVWTARPDGSSEFSNQRWLEYTGLSREQAQDWGYTSAMHAEDYERLLRKWTANFASGEPIEDEARMRRADGEYRWFLHRAVPLRDEQGEIVRWYGTSTDIEDRKRAEEVLREQAQLLDLTHDTVFVRDMNDITTYWNRGAEELYGWGREEAVGKVSHQLMQTIFPAPLEEITATLHRTGRWEGELVHTRRDGTQVTVASRWSLQRDERGQPVATLETNNDITARKQTENALRRSEAYLAEAQRLSRTGSFGWNVAGGELIWSDETFRIFEYDPATTTPTVELGLRRIHPEDLPSTRQLMERVAREGKDWESERRLLMPDGSVKYVHTLARAMRDELGRLEFVGALMDVTAARQAEAELRRSEAYLAEAQRLSHTGSWAVNLQRPEERYWSAETYRIFGLDPTTAPPSPVIGPAPPPWVHPEDWPKVQRAAEAAIREKTNFEVHYRAVLPGGSTRYLYVIGHPVVNAAGEVVELVGTLMDLTERRRAERALRRARERALKVRFAAVLDERTRLAREIHDTLLQGFTGVALQLVAVTNRLTGPPEIAVALHDVVSLAQKTLQDARRAVWDLRTPSLGGGDFPTALRAVAEDCVRGTGLALEYSVEGAPRPLDPDVEAAASRVAQEAITNVVKHAAASTVGVRLSFEQRGVRLSVTDDGRGFAVDPDFQAYGGHWGLLGMHERATQIQGKLRVRSAAEQGTEVVLLVPYHARRRELTPTAGTP